MGPRAAAKTSFKLVWRCQQLLCGLLANGHLSRVSCQSRLSANDKGDIDLVPEAVHKSPGIYLIAKEIPGKPQLGTVDEYCATTHCLKRGPLSPNEVGIIAQHVRKGEGRKK